MKQNAKRLLKALWIKACRFDGIPIDSKFVVFSKENHYANRHNKISRLVLAGSSKNHDSRNVFSIPLT